VGLEVPLTSANIPKKESLHKASRTATKDVGHYCENHLKLVGAQGNRHPSKKSEPKIHNAGTIGPKMNPDSGEEGHHNCTPHPHEIQHNSEQSIATEAFSQEKLNKTRFRTKQLDPLHC